MIDTSKAARFVNGRRNEGGVGAIRWHGLVAPYGRPLAQGRMNDDVFALYAYTVICERHVAWGRDVVTEIVYRHGVHVDLATDGKPGGKAMAPVDVLPHDAPRLKVAR